MDSDNRVDDVIDYYKTVLKTPADTYILAAAVANLMPSTPYEGKFPSHNYKVGEKFNIEFEIAPRLIDQIKKVYPRSTLIGYKLFDGSIHQLVDAATHTLVDSKANLIFANDPAWAKEKKIAVTADGAAFPLTFDEHLELINKLVEEEWFITQRYPINKLLCSDNQEILNRYPKFKVGDQTFGCFAIRHDKGMLTTTRGKRDGLNAPAYVHHVDFEKRIIQANTKATLNAPLLFKILEDNPHINYLIHGHDRRGEQLSSEYEFPGSVGDLKNSFKTTAGIFIGQMKHHGYIAGFSNIKDCLKHCDEYKLAKV